MSRDFWMPKEVGSFHEGETELAYDNSSRVEAKRSHQWFVDGPEENLFPSKKQALEIPANNNSFLGLLNSNLSTSPWNIATGFHPLSSHFSEQLFDNEAPRTANYGEQSIPSIGTEKLSVGEKVHGNLFLNDSSFALSMSSISDDHVSSLNYNGGRKVKVSEVKDSEHIMPVSMGHSYNSIESNDVLPSSVGHPVSMGHSYNSIESNDVLPSSVGQDDTISLRNGGGKGGSMVISMETPNDTERQNTPMRQPYQKDGSNMSISHSIVKDENGIADLVQSYRADDSSISMNNINKGSHDPAKSSTGHFFGKGQSSIISFGGYDDMTNPSESYNYELFMGQHALQTSNTINGISGIDLIQPNADAFTYANASQISLSRIENSFKKNEEQSGSKRVTSNNFPSNVKSLLSTGILDGIIVKYMAWQKEKELRGVIKGTGYLCGCQSCNYNKIINAYELERHAGCKTKHPNNHIYFENGKTIYGVVLELRSTPQNMLFDTMQTITGSPINQRSFQLWKESYLAATRELQRVYGKDGEGSFF